MIFKFDVAPVVEGQPHPNRTIVLVPPLGFSLNRDRFHFAAKDGVHGEVIIRRTQDAGRGRILTAAILSTESSSNPARRGDPISTTYFSFTYVPLVTLRLYFLLGVLGIAIGYFVRAAKKLLDSTQPAPHRVALAQAQAIRAAGADNVVPPSTPQTLFWKYWYLLDFGVTVILGIVVLITLMQNGLPPTTAGYPVNAFAIGFGIGLLTNTEIITKVTPR
ncbi:MAG TPA: hypothetical protein VEK79_03745 [Thermoanaerobaculia bacterium]|nr:hypothetical protein [Thermoanaerobaculia bacterium]